MKIEVRYYTRSGNTKKLAEAIAKAVGAEAKTVEEPLREDVDILFLGSSVYAYGVDDSIKKFISGIDVTVGKVVNFSTAALIKSTYKQVGKLLAQKGIEQAEEEFYCKGSFGPMHKGKPDEKDCAAAAAFAKKVIS
ncbi:MAG: flavodoxin [Acetatifactor sp.]|nr:flavodoxin [Acetatifactor sp.]